MSVSRIREEHKRPFYEFYKHLPHEFLPLELVTGPPEIPKEQWNHDAWEVYLCKTFPRSRIPSKLTLKSGFSFQPPRFLFGWAMENSVLNAIAEHCHYTEDVKRKSSLQMTVIVTDILRQKLPHVMDALGYVVIHPVMTYEGDKYKLRDCIALADSWITGNRKPTPEHVETLREFFGIGKGKIQALANNEPMWWMDLLVPNWHYTHKKDDLKRYRPWDLRKKGKK